MIQKIALCTIALSVLTCCSSNNEKRDKDNDEPTAIIENKPTEVKAMLLDYSDFHYELISNGTVAAMNKADLHFQSQDNILKIYVKNGQWVSKGQKLAELDKFKMENALVQAKEALDKAKLELQDVLIGQGFPIADSLKIPAETMKIAKLRSNYDQSMNNYLLAEYNLKATTLYAPFGGVVANLTAKEYNQPGSDPFCTIIDNQHPEVVFNILENELSLVNMNDKVIVSPFSQADFSVEGRISEINPMVDKNGMVRVKAAISNRNNRFFEGMNVKVKVQRLLGKQLIIPKSALVMRTNRKVVFTLKDNKAIWVYVETAQENSDSYVVTSGLNTGDSIIYDGNINLAHEAPVILER